MPMGIIKHGNFKLIMGCVYRQILDKACNGKCSEIFSISCPSGQLWSNCLDISKVHLMKGNSNIIASKS